MYKEDMGHLPESILSELRSPARALADLIDKFNSTVHNHPDLPKMAQMIRVLSAEIALRHGSFDENAVTRSEAALGLC
jgi:hypothetical protein